MYRKDGAFDPGNENKSFWEATPSGEITLTITNPEAAFKFVPGTAYYVDFTSTDG